MHHAKWLQQDFMLKKFSTFRCIDLERISPGVIGSLKDPPRIRLFYSQILSRSKRPLALNDLAGLIVPYFVANIDRATEP